MQTRVERSGADCLVLVSGPIAIDSSPDLRALVLSHLKAADCASLTVDLHDVEYLDTSGLAILLETLKAARGYGKPFHLSGVRGRPRYLLEVTRILPLFSEVSI